MTSTQETRLLVLLERLTHATEWLAATANPDFRPIPERQSPVPDDEDGRPKSYGPK